MKELRSLVESRGGMATKADLVRLGATDHDLTFAVRTGALNRVRRGWYSTLPKADPRVTAVAVGGRLTGAAALRLLGAWMWAEPPLEIVVPRNASRLRPRPRSARVYWNDDDLPNQTGSRGMVDVPQALVHAIPRVAFEEAVALLDWAISSQSIDQDGLAEVISRLPRTLQRIERFVDAGAASFPESVVRTRLRLEGREVTTQVAVGEMQRIDMVVDGVVAIEFDGRAWHADTFEADRRKDLRILAEGRVAMRLSYGMVRREWSAIVAAVESAVSLHRSASRSRRHRQGGALPLRTLLAVPWSLPRSRPRSAVQGMQGRSGRLVVA